MPEEKIDGHEGHEVHQHFIRPEDVKGNLIYNILGIKGNFSMLMQGLQELIGYAKGYDLAEQNELLEIYQTLIEIDGKLHELIKQ